MHGAAERGGWITHGGVVVGPGTRVRRWRTTWHGGGGDTTAAEAAAGRVGWGERRRTGSDGHARADGNPGPDPDPACGGEK